jgi:hypothetical protein
MSRGTPLHAKNTKDQCEAVTFETHWKRDRKVDLRCPFIARITIGKKRLCHKHAQLEALAILVDKDTAQIIPQPERRLMYEQVSVVKKPIY